jgi:hypothetical protein
MKSTFLAVCLALAQSPAWAESAVNPYPAAYAASMKDRLPVLVFVGQPAREVPGTRSISVSTFPEATAPCVVVGVVQNGEMLRHDLAGTPSASDIQATAGLRAVPATTSTSAYPPTSAEALDEVNAARAARGLRPFIHDANLTAAAAACAEFRAARLIAGHTSNDFAALPAGASASASGCAAWSPGDGWGACCTYEGYTYGGAAYATGRDGRRYMHLFVR